MSELINRIVAAVRRELQTTLFLERPEPVRELPCDIDAEQVLCAAAMCGQIKPSELPYLRGADFYANIHAYVWVACDTVLEAGMRPTEQAVLAWLRTDGIESADVTEDVQRIARMTPCVSRRGLESRARRVVALHDARRLIAALEQLAAELRVGAVTADEARARLGRAFGYAAAA